MFTLFLNAFIVTEITTIPFYQKTRVCGTIMKTWGCQETPGGQKSTMEKLLVIGQLFSNWQWHRAVFSFFSSALPNPIWNFILLVKSVAGRLRGKAP